MVAQAYYAERIVWLVVFPILTVFALLMLHQDYARARAKRSLNLYHVRQHVLQVILGVLTTAEAMDYGVFGIYPPWLLGLFGGVNGSLLFACVLISAYLLARGLHILHNERDDPGRLYLVFVGFAVGFGLAHIPIQVAGLVLGTPGPLPMIDTLVMCVIGIGTGITVTTVFVRIRKICHSMDAASGSSSKIGPKLRKMGRVVLWLDVVIVLILAVMLAGIKPSAVFVDIPADGSYKVTNSPIIRLLILSLTMFWAYHPLRKTEASRPTTTSVKESHSTSPGRGSESARVKHEAGTQEQTGTQEPAPQQAEPDSQGPRNSTKDYDNLV
jgi:hypothetical protein